jgi:hypothetical protein
MGKNLCREGCEGGGGEENCLKNEKRGKLLFKIEGGKNYLSIDRKKD